MQTAYLTLLFLSHTGSGPVQKIRKTAPSADSAAFFVPDIWTGESLFDPGDLVVLCLDSLPEHAVCYLC